MVSFLRKIRGIRTPLKQFTFVGRISAGDGDAEMVPFADVVTALDIELDDIVDVNAPTPTDGQALLFDDASSKWIPGTGTGLSQEEVEDVVGGMMTDSATIDFTYDDDAGVATQPTAGNGDEGSDFFNPDLGEDDVPVSGGVTHNWASPTNIQTAALGNATLNSAAGPHVFPFLRASDFGFAIPTSATVLGITGVIHFAASPGSAYEELEVRLAWGASAANLSTGNKASGTTPAIGVDTTYGGTSDLWGELASTLTPAVINSSDFGLVFKPNRPSGATSRTLSVDYFRVSVTHTTGLGTVTADYIGALNDNSDVVLTSPQDRDTLIFDTGAGKWVNTASATGRRLDGGDGAGDVAPPLFTIDGGDGAGDVAPPIFNIDGGGA